MIPKSAKTRSWRIGKLAKTAGVSADTLRHYERKGVLQAHRSVNGYREFSEDAVDRLHMIRRALALGFTLDELRAIFKVFDQGGAPCQQVRTLAANKLAEIETHLQEVIALRLRLREALKQWDQRLSQAAAGQRAGLLRALAARQSAARPATSTLQRKPRPKQKGNAHD